MVQNERSRALAFRHGGHLIVPALALTMVRDRGMGLGSDSFSDFFFLFFYIHASQSPTG